MAVIIVGIIIVVLVLIPAAARGVCWLYGEIGGRRERRRTAQDEERAIELAAWSTIDAADTREEGSLSGETLCVK